MLTLTPLAVKSVLFGIDFTTSFKWIFFIVFPQQNQLQYLQLRLFRVRGQLRQSLRKESLRRHRGCVERTPDQVRHFTGKHHPVRAEYWNRTHG